MTNGNGRGKKMLGGAIIIGGVSLVAYFLLTSRAKGKVFPPGGAKPPPPDSGKQPPPQPPLPPLPGDPPTTQDTAALNVSVTINGQTDLGDAYFFVQDGSGKWSSAYPLRDGRACVSNLIAGSGQVNVQKNGVGAIPGVSNGWGGWNSGNRSVYLYGGQMTYFRMNVDDTRPEAHTTGAAGGAPYC